LKRIIEDADQLVVLIGPSRCLARTQTASFEYVRAIRVLFSRHRVTPPFEDRATQATFGPFDERNSTRYCEKQQRGGSAPQRGTKERP